MTLTIAHRRPMVALFLLFVLVGLGALPSASAYPADFIEARCTVAFESSLAANSCETSGSDYTMSWTGDSNAPSWTGDSNASCQLATLCQRTTTSSATTLSGFGGGGESEGEISGTATEMVDAAYTGSRDDMSDLRNCNGVIKKTCS